jgi:hypothetical protein
MAPSFESIEKTARVLDVPEAVLFSAGTMSVPIGERGRLLQRINIHLSKLTRVICYGCFPPHSQQRFVRRAESPVIQRLLAFPQCALARDLTAGPRCGSNSRS